MMITTSGMGKPRVLVLDSLQYQKLFHAILSHDYELLAAQNAGEAILIASSQKPDLILLGCSSDNPEGISVAQHIRDSASSTVPILLMLTSDLPTLRREAERAGCNGFLMKPLDPLKLKSEIESYLKGSVGKPQSSKP